MCFNLGLIRLFAWALKGERAHGEQPKRGQNVSLVAGLSLTDIVGAVSLLGACDGLTFEAFMATRLVPNLWPGACVLMDNSSIYQEAVVLRLALAETHNGGVRQLKLGVVDLRLCLIDRGGCVSAKLKISL